MVYGVWRRNSFFQVLLTKVSFFRQCRQVTPAAVAAAAVAAATPAID
jgi:hypothetical protein